MRPGGRGTQLQTFSIAFTWLVTKLVTAFFDLLALTHLSAFFLIVLNTNTQATQPSEVCPLCTVKAMSSSYLED